MLKSYCPNLPPYKCQICPTFSSEGNILENPSFSHLGSTFGFDEQFRLSACTVQLKIVRP